MDLTKIQGNILAGIVIFLLLVASVYLGKRKTGKSPIGIAIGLLRDTNKNLKLVEVFSFHWQTKRFRTGNWKRNSNKIDFLPQELRDTLSRTFSLVEEANQKIDSARKYKSGSYMAGINVDKMKEPLAKTKQELGQWLRENAMNPAYQPKRRGLFG